MINDHWSKVVNTVWYWLVHTVFEKTVPLPFSFVLVQIPVGASTWVSDGHGSVPLDCTSHIIFSIFFVFYEIIL